MAANVKVIPPRDKAPDILRVVAYCRVSSDSSDQLHSYAAQIRNYTSEISKHDGWELVDVYADESIILGLGQEVLVPQGFPGLVLIFMRPLTSGPYGRLIEKCVELSPSPIRRAA